MNKSQISYIFSFFALFAFIFIWDEMFLFTKNYVSTPNSAHLLTIFSLAPVIFLTPLNDRLFKKVFTVILLVPALVIVLKNLFSDQFLSATIVNLTWVVILYTLPISILLGLTKYFYYKIGQK